MSIEKYHQIREELSSGFREKNYSHEVYREIFQEEILKKDVNYDLLAKLFEDIGDSYKIVSTSSEMGATEESCQKFTEALLYYQYAIQILTRFIDEKYDISPIKSKILELYNDFQLFIGQKTIREIDSEGLMEKISYKKEIESLRQEVKIGINEIQLLDRTKANYKTEYTAKASDLINTASSKIKQYLANIVRDAEKFCGIAPCKYSLIGLGSMAMNQITPYSDLEFAVLVEKDNENVQEYFLKFGHYINFAIIALGESIIPHSRYGIHMDGLVKRALNLDLGGKTSLGRIDKDKDYKLVCDIQGMISNLTGKHNKTISDPKKIDEKLPHILSNICHIWGAKELTNEYQNKASEFLASTSENIGISNAQTRAKDILSSDGIFMKSNLNEFAFNCFEKEGQLFDVKQEIYRIPDRMIYNLGQIYNIEHNIDGISPLDIITKLEEKEYIPSLAAAHFRFIVSYANILRLRVYDFYGEQRGNFDTLLETNDQKANHFVMDKGEAEFIEEDTQLDGNLIEFYYTIIPLMDALETLCEIIEKDQQIYEEYFSEYQFYSSDDYIKVDIAFRLLMHDKVIEYGAKLLEKESQKNNHLLHDKIWRSYRYKCEYEKALFHCKKVLEIKSEQFQQDDDKIEYINIATNYANLASIYLLSEKYIEAKKEAEKALKVLEGHSKIESYMSVIFEANLGYVFLKLDDPDKALKLLLGVTKLDSHTINKHKISIASIYNNIGLAYYEKEDYNNALIYYNKSLDIKMGCYGEFHPYLATLYNNLATTYGMKKEIETSFYYCRKSMYIREKYLDENHLEIADSYASMARLFQIEGDYKKASYYCKKTLDIREKFFGDEQPKDSITFYRYASTILVELENFQEAAKYYVIELKLISKHIGHNSDEYKECSENLKKIIYLSKTLQIIESTREELENYKQRIDHSAAKISKNPKKLKSEKRHELKEVEKEMLLSFDSIPEYPENGLLKTHSRDVIRDYIKVFIKLYTLIKNDEKASALVKALPSFESSDVFQEQYDNIQDFSEILGDIQDI